MKIRTTLTLILLTALFSCNKSDQPGSTGVAPQPVKDAPQGYGPPGGATTPPTELVPKKK